MTADATYKDEELLALMAEDNEAAFSAIYRRYWETMFISAVRITHSREQAEDIIQEVFLSLWNRRKEKVVSSSLSAYLFTSVFYQSTHYIEKNISKRNYLQSLTEHELGAFFLIESQLQAKELEKAVTEVVEQMPPKMRLVYELSRQEQLPHKEIAVRLGISDETVRKHIHHALRLIRSSLDEKVISFPLILTYFLL